MDVFWLWEIKHPQSLAKCHQSALKAAFVACKAMCIRRNITIEGLT